MIFTKILKEHLSVHSTITLSAWYTECRTNKWVILIFSLIVHLLNWISCFLIELHFLLIIKLDSLNGFRESDLILNYTLQNVLGTYCSNVLDTCGFPFKYKLLFYFIEKLRRWRKNWRSLVRQPHNKMQWNQAVLLWPITSILRRLEESLLRASYPLCIPRGCQSLHEICER